MKDSQSSYFDSNEFLELLNSYESMVPDGAARYFDGIDISNLAEFYSSMDEDGKAEEVIRFGLGIHPGDPDILISKGHLLLRQGKSKEARTLAESISETGCRELLFLKGNIELFDDDAEMADRYFCQSVEAGFEDLGLYADIVSLFTDYALYDYAQKWLDKALCIEPDYKDFLEQQADLYFAIQDYQKATDQYNLLLDESPYEIYYWEQLALIAYRQEEWPKALECFEYMEAIDPLYDSLGLIKAECLIEANRYADAEKTLRAMLEQTPDAGEILFMLGNVLSLQQKNEEALGYMEQAVGLIPDDPQMNLQLAAVQHECGKFKDAAYNLTKAFRCGLLTHPDNIRLLMIPLLQQEEIDVLCDMLIALFDIPELDMKEYGVFLPALTMCCWQSVREADFRKYFSMCFDANSENILKLFGITDLTTSKELAIDVLISVAHAQSSVQEDENNSQNETNPKE